MVIRTSSYTMLVGEKEPFTADCTRTTPDEAVLPTMSPAWKQGAAPRLHAFHDARANMQVIMHHCASALLPCRYPSLLSSGKVSVIYDAATVQMLVLSITTHQDTKPQLCCLLHRLHIHLSTSPCFSAFLEPTPAEKLRQKHRALVAYAQRTGLDGKRLSIAKARDPRVSNIALRGLLDLCDDVYDEVKRRQNQGKAAREGYREWVHGSERRIDGVHPKRKEMQEAMRGSSELQLWRLVAAVLVELEERVPKLRHEEKPEMVEVGDEPSEPVRRHKDLGKLMGLGV